MPTDFTIFAEKKENQRIHISPQLTLAMFQYLSTSKEQYLKTYLRICKMYNVRFIIIYHGIFSQLWIHLNQMLFRNQSCDVY